MLFLDYNRVGTLHKLKKESSSKYSLLKNKLAQLLNVIIIENLEGMFFRDIFERKRERV